MVKTNFFYRYGRVFTNKMWNRPSWSVFWKWWNEFKSNIDLEDFSVYMGGKFIISPNETNDVDIILTGPIYDYKHLYNIFKYGLDLSINKYGIYVDLCWYDNVDFFKYPRRDNFIRYHNLIKMSGIEYKIINSVCVLDILHQTTDKNLQIPDFLSFNRVQLPMDKQISDGRIYSPIKLV